jgi:hypothetical protein
VLIKSPGIYKLEKLTVQTITDDLPENTDVVSSTGVSSMSASLPASECFYACFPVVLRSLPGKEPLIEARDRDGAAAVFTFRGEIVRKRKTNECTAACFAVGRTDLGK